MSRKVKSYIAMIVSLFLPALACATSIEANVTSPDIGELAPLGIKIEFHDGLLCEDATDILVSVPSNFRKAKYSGAMLTIREKGKLALSVNLPLIEAESTAYSEMPFRGVSFCLHPSMYDSASLSLYFKKGDIATDIIELNGVTKYAK